MTDNFVFGSNLAGRHGKGAPLHARKHHGAIYGQGEGLQGRSYAIPTKDGNLRTLPLDSITEHVATFLKFALFHPEMRFLITPVGCGLAGYSQEQIWPMFDHPLPRNCVLDSDWDIALSKDTEELG